MKIYLQKLLEHQVLTNVESEELIYKLCVDNLNQSHLASLMSVYLMRPIAVDELKGFKTALMSLCKKINFDVPSIDVCGTGGDEKNTFNISTLSALVVAGAGIKVTKHGNYGASSISGSSNVLEYFGYEFTNDETTLKKQLDKFNICFMHAPLFHPALKSVGSVRKEIGIKTFFNMLGPLVNPANPKNRMVGVYSKELARVYNYIFAEENKNYSVISSDDGFDEISLTSNFTLFSQNGEFRYSPFQLINKRYLAKELFGGNSIEESALIFKNILSGNFTPAQKDVVIINAAFAIQCATGKNLHDAIGMAQESLLGKKAFQLFKNLTNKKP